MAQMPAKKKQTAGNTDWSNTAGKTGPVTTEQAHGAMKAFAKKQKDMSSKTRKRVAKRLKGMVGGK